VLKSLSPHIESRDFIITCGKLNFKHFRFFVFHHHLPHTLPQPQHTYDTHNATRRRHAPPRRVPAISTRWGGHQPSLSCSSFLFDTTRRGAYPLLVVFFPFQHDEEGHAPSSSCCCSHFNLSHSFNLGMIGRVLPFLSCSFCSYFDATRRDTPSLSRYFHFHYKNSTKCM